MALNKPSNEMKLLLQADWNKLQPPQKEKAWKGSTLHSTFSLPVLPYA